MRLELASGIALLGWQIVAAAVVFTGQADALLSTVDPGWLATLCAIVVTPPPWVVWVAVGAGVGLIMLAQRAARLERLGEEQDDT